MPKGMSYSTVRKSGRRGSGRGGVKSNKHGTDKGPKSKLPSHLATPRPRVWHFRSSSG